MKTPPKILPRPDIKKLPDLSKPVSLTQNLKKEDSISKAPEIPNLAPAPPKSYSSNTSLTKFKSEWDKRNNDERFLKIFLSNMALKAYDSFKRLYEDEEEYPRALIIINNFFGKYDIKFKNIQEAIKIISETFEKCPPELRQSYVDRQYYSFNKDNSQFMKLVQLLKNEIKPPPKIYVSRSDTDIPDHSTRDKEKNAKKIKPKTDKAQTDLTKRKEIPNNPRNYFALFPRAKLFRFNFFNSQKIKTTQPSQLPSSQISQQQITEIEQSIKQLKINQEELKNSINHQLQPLPSSQHLNPKFALSQEDVTEIKFIQKTPELNEYYQRMQKCFNEAFLFAIIVSQGGASIEETSQIVKYLEISNELLGDIPFASLIISQVKSTASQISKAKTKGQQANLSDLILTADPVTSSLLAEKIARRFVITRQLSEQDKVNTAMLSLSLKNQGRIAELKKYFKAKFSKYLDKVDPHIQRGFFGKELNNAQQLAILDFDKSVQFIFDQGIGQDIKSLPEEDQDKSKKISEEIVSKTLKLPVKYYQDQGVIQSDQQINNQFSTQPLDAKTPELQELVKRIEEIEQQKNHEIEKLKIEIAQLKEGQKKDGENIEIMKDDHEKLGKLIDIAKIAPDLEITIGKGSQAMVIKLGDIIKNHDKNPQEKDLKIIAEAFAQISSQIEELQAKTNQPSLPSSKQITKASSGKCFPVAKKCAIM
ncbi:MAG: hypothetical protein RL769_525 [Pseudomonadota bacterium]